VLFPDLTATSGIAAFSFLNRSSMPNLEILGPRQTRSLLEEMGHFPRKQLGQNFLVDGNLVRKSLAMAEVVAGDTVVEIGPGLGTLTAGLLQTGASVYAVELDRVLADRLLAWIESSSEAANRFRLLVGDAVESPLAAWEGRSGNLQAHAPENLKIVANLPYAVSTPWFEALLKGRVLPRRIVVMLQKEAAQRYTAQDGSKNFGAISIFLQNAYQIADRHLVRRQSFWPVPDIDSVLLRLDLRSDAYLFSEAARKVIRELFTHRRKQLGSLLRNHPSAAHWASCLQGKGLSLQLRPEQIPLNLWREMASDGEWVAS
jgi:16S rRNA (adenine1518-N6/adenine1519-N6)-dimethyltransferase